MKLDLETACPLSPALVDLLQACVDARCIKDKTLAERLCLSTQTVHTNFRRIADALDTHDRFEVIYIAYENGWIRFAPPPRNTAYKSFMRKRAKIAPKQGQRFQCVACYTFFILNGR